MWSSQAHKVWLPKEQATSCTTMHIPEMPFILADEARNLSPERLTCLLYEFHVTGLVAKAQEWETGGLVLTSTVSPYDLG